MTKKMNDLLKFEELGQFILSIFLFNQLDFAWWVFPACILLPVISMLGYFVNTKMGAFCYNIFHHKFFAIAVFVLGAILQAPLIILSGTILFGHAAMDRLFGYGLKYNDNFKNTHLGWIKKN